MSAFNWLYQLRMVPVYANGCINPFIYAAKYGEFQTGVRRMIARITGQPLQAQSQQNTGRVQATANPTHKRSTLTPVTN